MTEPASEAGKSRFLMLQLLRLAGFIVAAAGIWLWRDAVQGGGSDAAGKILFVVGLFTTLLLPALLARRWRSRS